MTTCKVYLPTCVYEELRLFDYPLYFFLFIVYKRIIFANSAGPS